MKDYRLLKQVAHDDIDEFIENQLAEKGFYKMVYTTSLVVTVLSSAAAVAHGIKILILTKGLKPLIQIVPGFLFSFTLLILFHELLHALAYKLVGAKRVYFGAPQSKSGFYAGSDQEAFNGIQFRFIALSPFITISMTGLIALLILPQYFIFVLTVLLIHTLFCGGDFATLNFMHKHDLSKIHTYNSREKRVIYYYLEK